MNATYATDPCPRDAAFVLTRMLESLQHLSAASSRDALVQTMATELTGYGIARRVAYVTLEWEADGLALIPRGTLGQGSACDGLGDPNHRPFSQSLLAEVGALLKPLILGRRELTQGVAFLDAQGLTLGVVLVPDVATAFCAVIFDVRSPLDGGTQLALETLVRHFQTQAQWITELELAQSLVYRDDLTGLFNTRYFEVALDAELKRAQRFKSPFCLLFIDLDGFKPINDQHGHLSGGAVLKQVARVIRDTVREVDVPIRYGGDEFVVLIVGATQETGLLVAERLRRRIADEAFTTVTRETVHVTCSIGIAAFPDHGVDHETLLRMADETMYQSKRTGKNRVSFVPPRQEETT